MSEQDVREEIIAKIIDRLGYKFGDTYYCERERKLVHPYNRIGHRSKKDLPVGAADYICGIDGRRGCFTIEAKRGDIQIQIDDIIQAHSYAAHFEIGAKFFVVCNGHIFQIYETAGGYDRDPLVNLKNNDFEAQFDRISSILSPERLEYYSKTQYDIGTPIAPGLAPKISIKKGWLSYEKISYAVPGQPKGTFEKFLAAQGLIQNFQNDVSEILNRRQPIVAGIIGRDQTGRIQADVEFDSADENFAYNLAAMQLVNFSFTTESNQISQIEQEPTVFESRSELSVPQGTKIYNTFSKRLEPNGVRSDIKLYYRALAHLQKREFKGQFKGNSFMSFFHGGSCVMQLECHIDSRFTISII